MSMITLQADKGEKARLVKLLEEARDVLLHDGYIVLPQHIREVLTSLGEQVEAREQTEEPRTRTLLRSMLAAFDSVDDVCFFECHRILTGVLSEALGISDLQGNRVYVEIPLPAGAPEKKEE